jgi:hypothetical protein
MSRTRTSLQNSFFLPKKEGEEREGGSTIKEHLKN